MDSIQLWYEEVVRTAPLHTFESYDFVIYKGFKMTRKHNGRYILEDVRFSNMYSPVDAKDYRRFERKGFVRGVDEIGYERDKKRVRSYRRRAEKLYDKRKRFKAELPDNRPLNEKRIRNINKKIDVFIDLMFFYNTRIAQFNLKYNK